MKLLIGLGNPGKRYEKTRHNVGFMVLDALLAAWEKDGAHPWALSSKFNAEIAHHTIGKEKIYLVKPMTFMNESGQATSLVAEYYRISPQDIIVIHDDKDIPLGEVKVQKDRGHAGHNGVRSIIDHIGTKDFLRIRVGIAHPEKQGDADTADFVLGKFGLLERKEVTQAIHTSINHILSLVTMK